MSTEEPTKAASPPLLEYGRRSRFGFIGRNKKKLIFLALCIAIGVPIYRNWEPLKRRAVWIYWVHQAAAFQMPAQPFERVIIDPDRAKAAVAANSDYLMDDDVAIYAPLAYRRLVELDPRIPKSWRGTITSHLVFMGTMLQPDGTPRLVIVTEDRYMSGPCEILVFPVPGWADAIPQGTKLTRSSAKDFIAYPVQQITSSPAYTATLDPNDRSHLTFSTERPANYPRLTATPVPATTPSAPQVENTQLFLKDDGRFLERLNDGPAYMIEPIERPPRPTVRGK